MRTESQHRSHVTSLNATFDRLVGRAGPIAVRWLLGLMWLSNANWKVPQEFTSLRKYINAGVEHPVLPGSAWIFEQIILPRMSTFGWITLFIEVGLAAAFLSGRFLRVAGIVSVVQSFAIGLAVANAPHEWYWAYLLMIGLSIAVIVEAPRVRPPSPRTTAIIVAAYGLIISANNLLANPADGGKRTLFTGGNDIPDQFANAVFAGAVALGIGFVAVAAAAWFISAADERIRTIVGGITIAVAAVLLLTYRSSPRALAIGLGSRAVHCAVLAVVGLSLLPINRRQGVDRSAPDGTKM